MTTDNCFHALTQRIPTLKERLTTEEATKQSLVLPFLQCLGYNVFDPHEVEPEYTADIGSKQGEKVDYAILSDGEPVILIECKKVSASSTGMYPNCSATSGPRRLISGYSPMGPSINSSPITSLPTSWI